VYQTRIIIAKKTTENKWLKLLLSQ